jgi:two-component system sensor histidine kinase VicK
MESSEGLTPVRDSDRLAVIKRYEVMDTPRLAIEAANVGTWLIDKDTRVFMCSPRVKELFGYNADDELSFESAMMRVAEKYRDKVILSINEAIISGEPYQMDFPVKGFRDHKSRWVKTLGGLYQDPDEELTHFSGVMLDITVQKEKEARKNKLIGMVSHELKTPLTSLKAYVQMLHAWAKKQKDHFTVGTLSKVEKQVKKMSNMINGFLSLSQVESGKIHLMLQDVELTEVINETIEEVKLLNPDQIINFKPGGAVHVHADADKLEQVMINFLSNAIKYTPKGGTIEVDCQVVDDKAQVSVTDEGMGIDQKDIDRLFERFYRVESKATEKIPGFGIGLYLCAEIIRHHHGKIWVNSQTGKGSTFYFEIPVLKKAE